MKRKNAKATRNNNAPINDANSLLAGVIPFASQQPNMLSQPLSLTLANAYTPLSLNKILLSYSYMTHGILQTLIDQPVEDAFRGGLIFKSDELDGEDIEALTEYMEHAGVIKTVKDVMRWGKLFGGAGIIINTDQDPKSELDVDAIGEDTPIAFISADRWELLLNFIQIDHVPCPYNYYGQPIHKSRVIKIMGKEAPSYIRKRLQGWGMSEVERVIRPLNAFVKNEDVCYELLDEAKIDVWKIKGFNTNILSKKSQAAVNDRLQVATAIKNYHRAIAMDKEDDYDQKQIAFAGLPEMLRENRIGIASAIRMPLSKLFGLSAEGFSSGQDDIENYNSLIESEVRAKAREILHEILPVICKKLFGFIPESLKFEFHPLRVLSSEQEENIKSIKFNRLSTLYSQGILNAEEYCEAMKQENIFTMDTEVGNGKAEPEPPQSAMSFESPKQAVGEKAPEEKK